MIEARAVAPATRSAGPDSIHDVLVAAAAERPAQVAIIGEDRQITYGELLTEARRTAAALVARGLRPGDRLGFLGATSIELVALIFACSMARVVLVPFNWRLSERELDGVIADAAPALSIVEPDRAEQFDRAGAGRPRVLLEVGAGALHADQLFDPLPIAVDDPAWVIYTSGTTGAPKGVVLTQGNFIAKADGVVSAWRFLPGRVVYVASPVFHLTGIGWVLSTLRGGGVVVLRRSFDVARFVAEVGTYGVTNALMVPSVLNSVLAHPGLRPADLAGLRTIVYGVAPITQELFRRAVQFMPDCEFVHAYGLTEATGAVTWLSWEEHDLDGERSRSCGRAYPWVELQIVDPTTGEVCAPHVAGEVWTRSGNVMAGYLDNPAATAAAITPDGWLRTGDGGYLDDDGYLYLTDRLSDTIISGGENIYPAEVENVLAQHPAVGQVAAIGVPSPRWGETVKAVVVLRAGLTVTEEQLIAFARERIAHYKCPTSVDFADTLPTNPSGKILRRQLRLRYRNPGDADDG